MSQTASRPASRAARVGVALAVAMVVALGGACTPGGAAGEWPPRPPVVAVAMDDYAFAFDRPVPAGRVVFRFTNVGAVDHQASLVPLPEDLPSLEEQLAGDQRRDVPNFAEIQRHEPGEEGAFTVVLEEGRRYGLVCFLRDDDEVLHARKGMNAEFRAGGPDASPPADDPNLDDDTRRDPDA